MNSADPPWAAASGIGLDPPLVAAGSTAEDLGATSDRVHATDHGDDDHDDDAAEPDHALWHAAGAGDAGAFGVLFARHSTAVWNHAYRLTGSWAQAEDVTAATSLAAWRQCAEVRLVCESALPWLFTVAGNIAFREYRRSERFRGLMSRFTREQVHTDHADEVARSVDEDWRMRRIAAAVAALPRTQREAVELCLLGDVSIRDAAAHLGVAEVSVRSRLSRARARLRISLARMKEQS